MATVSSDLKFDSKSEIQPSGGWLVESTLPFNGHITSILTHSSDQIWVLTEEKLFRYRISTQAWTEFSTIENLKVIPKKLYESRKGVLWGTNLSIKGNLDTKQKIPLFVRYDDATGQFVFVRDRDNFLNSGMSLVAITESVNNPSGEMWILVDEETNGNGLIERLISFNPNDLRITKHLMQKASRVISVSPEASFDDIAIPSDGRIWIADRGLMRLLFYSPPEEKLYTYQIDPGVIDGFSNEDLRGYFNLYVDRMGRLWIDDRGWLDFSEASHPVWHKIVRSPVFITDSSSPENQFVWSRPYQMHHSSDGMYWFSDANVGLVKLDPKSGQWCKFTTASSPIAEDAQGNLWIAVFGRLYRYRLSQ